MPKRSHGFTLIEVLVAVMIIAVVIGSLIQLFATNTHTFSSVHQKILHTNKTTLLLGNEIYGYENKKVDLDELVKDFNIDDDLRRLLKKERAEILYTEVTSIDFGDAAEALAEAEESKSGNDDEALISEAGEATNTLEIGRTTLKIGGQSSSFLRVKFQ
ncbi:MAG: prepilin-type N-terminal cleavage/methylation domain-containing protein [Sulfurimonadaceae bacterium]